MRISKLALALLLASAPAAVADENIRPAAALRAAGYEPWQPSSPGRLARVPASHSLPWPVAFQDSAHSLGNSMGQFQPFAEPPYFHGGCDLRTQALAEIRTPVAGRIEAGHYGYEALPNGSLQKYWQPWPEEGDPTYFEVAVTDDQGIRYEFHHVDRRRLPASIVALLNQGGGRVEAGTLVGKVLRWPAFDNPYHHLHYNVILPDGTRLNPEALSPLLPDSLAPELSAAFAVKANGQVESFSAFAGRPAEFVVEVQDRQNENTYVHPPARAQLRFASGETSGWDFTQTLTAPDGSFPSLPLVFKDYLRGPNGQDHATEGGYGTGKSLLRLAVPPQASGPFTIELADIAGNVTRISGSLPSP